MSETILVSDILVEDRIRVDLGGIDKLADSIKKFGVIQPIVLTEFIPNGDNIESPQNWKPKLVAGGRRLTALKRLGVKELKHGIEFIWRGEEDKLMRSAVELEENLQRKELTWQEELSGKQKLLEIMQRIHGLPKVGPQSQIDSRPGFGVNKLAAMLGESTGKTSQDLQLARAIAAVPALASLKNKSEALTKLKIVGAVVEMQSAGAEIAKLREADKSVPNRKWILYEEDFRSSSEVGRSCFVPNESVDLIWTDLPYGSDVGKMSGQAGTTLASFDDGRDNAIAILPAIARESFRVLRPERFAVFCFGFSIYTALVRALETVGFRVNLVPVIWTKNSKSGENPNTRYCNSYEPILVATKGSPQFIRPGHGNVVAFPIVQDKLQAVQKPVELVEYFIQDMVGPDAVVCDWCAGTGTTGVAAHNTGRFAILFEQELSMATIAKARLEALK
jgi:hypothetical protein